ncbi:hypothetical protein Dimus_023211 [Dionaea muscipula]
MGELPSILDGSARGKAQPQDDSKATQAPKVSPEESWLSFDQEASVLHNKVRAFAGWPGTRAKVQVVSTENDTQNVLEIKVVSTRVSGAQSPPNKEADTVTLSKGALVFPCGGNTALEVRFLVLILKSFSQEVCCH